MRRTTVTRRGFLASAAGAAALPLLAACGASEPAESTAPEPLGPPFSGTLRVLGLKVDLFESIREAAERDLGFKVRFETGSSAQMLRRAIASPASFDLLSGNASQVDELWRSGAIVALERARLPLWPSVMSLYKLGRYEPAGLACDPGTGDAPFRVLYASAPHETSRRVLWSTADGAGARGPEPAAVTGSPVQLGIESFGYDTDTLAREPAELSWAELLNRAWAGRVALTDDPVVGFQEAALAASAAGLLDAASPATPTLEELDALTRILLELGRAGQFRAFPSTFDESVDLIAGKEVVLGPLSPPALRLLQASGYPVRQAAPAEGYRAWAGLLFLSRETLRDPSRLQACYEYATWWLSGVPGSLLMRQGYVNAALQTSLELGTVSQDEWDYWVGGEPAGSDLATPFGEGSIMTGDRLDGGSLGTRACSISTWLSSFGENAEHAAERWATVLGG